MKYFDVYAQRLNKYGTTYQERVQGQREKGFDLYLAQVSTLVHFSYENEDISASLERDTQDESKTIHSLLTERQVEIPSGTILNITNQKDEESVWMIYYKEEIATSGYNKYIVLKMTHYLTWTAKDGSLQESWAYMYGKYNLQNADLAHSNGNYILENEAAAFFIMPVTPFIDQDNYLIIGEEPLQEYYRVLGYDRQSTKGIEYVSVDRFYELDETPAPEKTEEDDPNDFFWLDGGGT